MLTKNQAAMFRSFPFQNKIKDRTAKQATKDENEATHVVTVNMPGCGTGADMDVFQATGAYSDFSGCDLESGDRTHGFYVKGEENAKAMKERILVVADWLDKFNEKKLGITVKITKKK